MIHVALSCVGSMSIGNLRVLAERLFKLKAAQQALLLRLAGDALLRSLGTDDTQPLSFFGVEVRQHIGMLMQRFVICNACVAWGKATSYARRHRAVHCMVLSPPPRGPSSCCRMDQRFSYPQRMSRLVQRRYRPRSRHMLRFIRGGWTSNSRQALQLTVKPASVVVGSHNDYQPARSNVLR